MSKLAVAGNASGTGVFTLSTPNSNTDRTFTFPDMSGEIGINGATITTTTGTTAAYNMRGGAYVTTGNMTVPSGVFGAGDVFSIYNNTAANITITQGAGLTLRQAGSANTGNRTLALRGLATVFFVSSSEAIVSGAGVS